MEKFRIRASSAHDIMMDGKKSGEPSVTLINVAETFVKEQIYGYKKSFSSKYTEKGIEYEGMAIEMAIKWLNLPLLTRKNEERFENEYMTGEPDIILDDRIIDIKNSWDFDTFPLFADTLPDKRYYAQLQVYMHLCNKKKGQVVYMLMDTPETSQNMAMSYDHVLPKFRYKVFDIDYDIEFINKLITRVEYVRELCDSLLTKI